MSAKYTLKEVFKKQIKEIFWNAIAGALFIYYGSPDVK
jgi:hypothetical protein